MGWALFGAKEIIFVEWVNSHASLDCGHHVLSLWGLLKVLNSIFKTCLLKRWVKDLGSPNKLHAHKGHTLSCFPWQYADFWNWMTVWLWHRWGWCSKGGQLSYWMSLGPYICLNHLSGLWLQYLEIMIYFIPPHHGSCKCAQLKITW